MYPAIYTMLTAHSVAISIVSPIIHPPPTALTSQSISSCLPKLIPGSKTRRRTEKARVFTQSPTLAVLSDPHVLQLAETLEDSLQSSSSAPLPPLQKLRDISAQSLLSTPWPSRKDEPFRFTDTSFIKNSHIEPISPSKSRSLASLPVLSDTLLPLNVTILDGYVVDSLSQLSELPDGVFVGGLSSITSEATMKRVSECVPNFQGDLFWLLNGVGAPDIIVIYVPEGCRVESPLHLKYFSLKGSEKDSKTLPISNPRVLVLVEKGGEIGIVEEYTGVDGTDMCYWANSVMEIVIGNGAKVSHSYIQTQSLGAAHIKWTSVRQVKVLVSCQLHVVVIFFILELR